MTKQTLVILKITDDDESRDWAAAIGLPPEERWPEELPADVHARVEIVERLHRPPPAGMILVPVDSLPATHEYHP